MKLNVWTILGLLIVSIFMIHYGEPTPQRQVLGGMLMMFTCLSRMINLPRYLVSCVALFAQNNYFGWNSKPQSDTELIADLICYLLLILAIDMHMTRKIMEVED